MWIGLLLIPLVSENPLHRKLGEVLDVILSALPIAPVLSVFATGAMLLLHRYQAGLAITVAAVAALKALNAYRLQSGHPRV